jgi:hypothetical protein
MSQNRVKPKKPSKTSFYPKKPNLTKPNQTETGWFEPVSVWFFLIQFDYFF